MPEKNYTYRDEKTLIVRPRTPRECSLEMNREKQGSVEKDASTFPLATKASVFAALESLYGKMTPGNKIALEKELSK